MNIYTPLVIIDCNFYTLTKKYLPVFMLLTFLLSNFNVSGQEIDYDKRERARLSYESKTLAQYEKLSFEKIPWLTFFNDPQLDVHKVVAMYKAKSKGQDLKVTFKGINKRFHFYEEMSLNNQRLDGKFNYADIAAKELETFKSRRSGRSSGSANFQFIGQTVSPFVTNNGRLERINFHPTDPAIVWASAPEGGLWRSNDTGANWTLMSDFWEHLSVGDLVYNTNNHDTLYCATGDHDSWFNLNRGILRSVDGGTTWNIVGLPHAIAQDVHKLLMHPDGRTVIACANTGIWTSSDHGVNWVQNPALIADINDLEFHPSNANIMYASERGGGSPNFGYFHVSIDGGATWTQQTGTFDSQGRTTQVTVSPNNPDLVYIGIYPEIVGLNNKGMMVMKYVHSTGVISSISDPSAVLSTALGGAWDFRLEVNPSNANHIVYGCVNNFESFDGGTTWAHLPNLHTDVHDIKWQPTSNKLWIADDGGLGYTTDGGANWTPFPNLPVMQWAAVASSADGKVMELGAQDAGNQVDYDGFYSQPRNGGDGLLGAVDPVDNTVIYTTIQVGLEVVRLNYNPSAQSYQVKFIMNQGIAGSVVPWGQNIVIDREDHNTIYTNYADIWKSTDQGENWTNMTNGSFGNSGAEITFFYQSQSHPDIMYGGNAGSSILKKSTDRGLTWTAVTHPGVYVAWTRSFVIHPKNPDILFACGNSQVLKSIDGGLTWTNISGSIPSSASVWNMAFHDNGNDGLYVAGDKGNLFYFDNTLTDWVAHDQLLPNVRIYQLEVIPEINKVRVATWGRGIWEGDTYSVSAGNCVIPDQPIITVQACATNSMLSIAAAPAGYDIAWYRDNVVIGGETGITLNSTIAGVHQARYLDQTGTCHSYFSEEVNVAFSTPVVLNTGEGLHFDGTDDFLLIPDGEVSVTNKSFSVEFWAKRDALDSQDYLFDQGINATNQKLVIGFEANNKFNFGFFGNDVSADAVYTDLEWHHWACVYDTSIVAPTHNRFIYRDGVLVASDHSTSSIQQGGNLIIGSLFGVFYFQGTMDEIKIWEKARTQTEIANSFNCPLTCFTEDLLLYMPFNEGTANGDNTALTSIIDYSIHNVTNTLTNFTLNGTSSNIVTGLNLTVYPDMDMDGFGLSTGGTTNLCGAGNYALIPGDCNDMDNTVHPYSEEVCANTADDNCDGNTDIDVNKSLDFDGSNDYVKLSNPWIYNKPFTIELWLKTTSADMHIMNWNDGVTGHSVQFTINSGGSLSYGEYDGAWSGWGVGPAVNDGNWHHVAISRTVNDISWYVDGVRHNTIGSTRNPTSSDFHIGRWAYGGGYFDGAMSDIRIWDTSLSETQIRDRMHLKLDGDEANLVRYYPLDHGQPGMNNAGMNIAKDRTSNDVDANLYNFALSGTASNWATAASYPTLYPDTDSDGFGGATAWTCGSMDNFVANNNDCNDASNTSSPYTLEICGNGVDDNCDGDTDFVTNKALNFDGANDHLLINNSGVDISNKSFTIEFWAKRDDATTNDYIFDQGVNGFSTRLHIGFQSNGNIKFGFYANDLDAVNGEANSTNWHHWAFVYDKSIAAPANNRFIYKDGLLVTSNLSSSDFLSTGTIYIGNSFGSSWLDGSLDEFRIWSDARSATELVDNMQRRIDGTETNLELYYSFDYGQDGADNGGIDQAKDLSGNNEDADLTDFALTGNSSNWLNSFVYPTLYADTDSDGFHSGATWTCGSMTAYLPVNNDCAEGNANVNSGAAEICGNGTDDNCNGVVDENTMALNFDGSNDFVNLGPTLGTFGTSDFTLEARFKNTGVRNAILSKREFCTCDNFWDILVNDTGEISFSMYEDGSCGNGVALVSTTNVDDNNWHHVAITRSGSGITMYIDGVIESSGSSLANITNSTNFDIGKSPCAFDNFYFNGAMDEVRVWNIARNASEINLYKSGTLVGNETGLQAYYNFNNENVIHDTDNSAETIVEDVTSNTFDGTLNNFLLTGTASNWIGNPIITQLWYADTDNDGYGDSAVDTIACAQPMGFVADSTDCNDAVMAINPGVAEIAGNSIDDDCDGAVDEIAAMNWVLLDNGDVEGSCTSSTDCCANTFCFGLEYTPGTTGDLAAYTTGFLVDCLPAGSPILSNVSCVMTDNSGEIDGCATESKTLINSSGNTGSLALTAGDKVIIHQICLTIPANTILNITEDLPTDLSTSIDLANGGVATEYPTFTNTMASGNVPPVVTAGTIDACYNSVSAAESAAIAATSATDDCPGSVTFSASTTGTCSAVITVTGEDACGLTASVTYNTSIHLSAPSEDGGPVTNSSTVECLSAATVPTTLPVVKDVCGTTISAPTPVVSDSPDPVTCEGSRTYTYTYTDCANLDFVWTYTYTIDHTTAPSEDGGPVTNSSTVECLTSATAPTVLPVVKDVCGTTITAPTPVVSDSPDPVTCEGTRTYTYTYSDCSNLNFVWTYTYTIDHTIAPSEDGGPVTNASTVECLSAATAPSTLPVVKDVCGTTITAPTPVVSDSPDPVSCEGTRTYTYTYSDCSNLNFVWTYTYTIDHTTAPSEDGGPVANSSTVECLSAATAPSTLPVVKDVCGTTISAPTPVVSDSPDPVTCEGIKTYTYTYSDCSNLNFVWTYTYTIDHTTAPSEDGGPVANSSTIECLSAATAPTVLPVVKDVCGTTIAAPTPVVTDGPDPVTCEGTRTYTYTYTDCSNLDFVWTYTYTIDHSSAPTEIGEAVATTSTVECLSAATTPMFLPTVQDACGLVITAPTPVVTDNPDPLTCEGTRTYTYTYSDCANLDFVWTFTYTIDHTTAPTEDGGPVTNASTVECLSAATVPTVLPVVKDVCGTTITAPTPVVTENPDPVTCEGTRTYTYTYSDCSNLDFVWTYTYTIDHTTAPTEDGGPVAISSTVECLVAATAPTVLPVVKDVCGTTIVAPTPVVSDSPDPVTCEGTRTYTYTYSDCSNLDFVWTYTYTIDHTTAPTEDGGPVAISSTVECLSAATAPAILPVVKDVCGTTITAPTPVVSDSPDPVTCEGTRTYTYTYSDCSNLDFVWTYTYTIDHTTVPSEDGGPVTNSSTVECLSAATAPTILPVIKDVCGTTITAPTPVVGDSPDPVTCEGTRTYTYTYSDCSNLDFVWTYTYTIDHTTAPSEDGGPVAISSTVECLTAATAPTILPVVKDVCGATIAAPTPVVSDSPDPVSCEGTRTYTYTYSDCSNLDFVWTYTYTIDLTTAPAEIGGPVDIDSTLQNISDTIAPVVLPVFQDVCGNVLVPTGPVKGGTYISGSCSGTVTYTYTYTDCSNQSVDWVYTYTIDCGVLNIFAYLEGAYNTAGDTMVTTLNANHLLPGMDKTLSPSLSVRLSAPQTPFGQPYVDLPWNYIDNLGLSYGDASAPSAPAITIPYPDHVVDWVLVSVRENGIAPTDDVFECAGWIHSDGSISFPEDCTAGFSINIASEYYVVLQHRNHLPVLDTATIMGGGSFLEIDFRNQDSYSPNVFRVGQKEIEPGVWGMYNSNGEQEISILGINSVDRTLWKINQNKLGYYKSDHDLNVNSNSQDETHWKVNQNKTTGVQLD